MMITFLCDIQNILFIPTIDCENAAHKSFSVGLMLGIGDSD
jgi:hypothetical protein